MSIPAAMGQRFHVDGAATNTAETGSAAAPFHTIQAALTYIGEPADAAEYAAEAGRAYTVRVAPGVYKENLVVPYRPSLLLDLDGATVRGTVTRRIPAWPRSWTGLVSRLTVRGDSLRAAYPDKAHVVAGIDGDVVYDGGGQTMGMSPTTFHELHVIHAGVSGAVRFANGSEVTWGHLFLERADVRAVFCTNGWDGVTVYAHNWGGGHTGGGNAGSGLGPLVGSVLPYNLQNVLISGGMRLESDWQCLSRHFDSFLAAYEARFQPRYGYLRPIIPEVVDKFLDCGDLEHGFARVRCDHCQHEYLLAFSCKGRWFCPSCHQKKVQLFGALLTETILFPVPHRHFTFTIPKMLRPYFRFDRGLLKEFCHKSFQLVRYYGWYSNKMRGQRDKRAAEEAKAAGKAVEVINVSDQQPRRIPSAKWRELIKKVWEADPLLCPKCRKEMRIVSLIDDKAVIERILRHLGLWQQGVRVATGPDPPADWVIETCLDDIAPDYDTDMVLACANA